LDVQVLNDGDGKQSSKYEKSIKNARNIQKTKKIGKIVKTRRKKNTERKIFPPFSSFFALFLFFRNFNTPKKLKTTKNSRKIRSDAVKEQKRSEIGSMGQMQMRKGVPRLCAFAEKVGADVKPVWKCAVFTLTLNFVFILGDMLKNGVLWCWKKISGWKNAKNEGNLKNRR
jgi:hypothetical protein